MKINYYYLVVGILSVLFSFTHGLNGHTSVLPVVDASTVDLGTKTTLFYVWHIITAENFIFGIAFLLMSFYKNLSKGNLVSWLIVAILAIRWGVIFGSTLILTKSSLAGILIDSTAMIIYVGLILLGIRQNNRNRTKISND